MYNLTHILRSFSFLKIKQIINDHSYCLFSMYKVPFSLTPLIVIFRESKSFVQIQYFILEFLITMKILIKNQSKLIINLTND